VPEGLVDVEPPAEPDGVETEPLADPDGLLPVWASATAPSPTTARARRRTAMVFMVHLLADQ
jgi:hypothetical protein